jgi:hypothetical protein
MRPERTKRSICTDKGFAVVSENLLRGVSVYSINPSWVFVHALHGFFGLF